MTAVLGDAESGENATLRRTLHRAGLPYALGVSAALTVFLGTPAIATPRVPGSRGRPRTRPQLAAGVTTIDARTWAAQQPTQA